MHDEVSVRNAGMDLLDAVYCKNIACRWAGKLVEKSRLSNGNGQGITLGIFNKLGSLFRIGQQLVL